ncbi:MAG TPA: S-layer homology domain-containing protein, partial [Clostridiales bacterium]|nr:S-layer homology domain-containing protein [Clostridiales bacterium]
MISKNIRRMISMVLVLLMTCQGIVFASTNDYKGHWAEDSIQSWIDKGYVKGYADGSFRPEADITRAEFISLVNRSFGFTEEAEVKYSDVADTHWAYSDFKRAAAAGYINGFEDGTLRPNNKISRQEMASIIARLLNLSAAKDSDAFLDLDDVDAIPEWSAGAVSALVDKGYIRLRDRNSFAPAVAATRAEIIDALNNSYLSGIKVIYNEAGTYTPGLVDGSVVVNAKDVILENATINGNLVISETVGEGNVTLKNVTVKGDTIVKGGGMNSIIIEDSNIRNLIIEKKDGKIRILAKGSTYVNNVYLQSGGKLETSDTEANNYGYVVIAENLSSDELITLIGNFESVEVRTGTNKIEVQGGTINNLVIAKTARNAKVTLAKSAKVKKAEINGVAASIDGKGEIKDADINADDSEIIKPTGETNTAPGVTPPKTSGTVTGTTGGSTGSSGGGSSTPSKVRVTGITITGEDSVVVGETLRLGVTV